MSLQKQPIVVIAVTKETPDHEKHNLKTTDSSEKSLRVIDGVAFIVACCVGSGMFMAPGEAAYAVGSPCGAILAFAVAGLLCLCGALCYSELGTTFSGTGADSLYLRKAFGDSISFTFSWTAFLVIGGGCCAAITNVLGEYTLQAFGVDPKMYWLQAKLVGVASLWSFALFNHLCPHLLPKLNLAMMVAKVGTALIILLCAIAGPYDRPRQMAFIYNNGASCFEGTNWMGFVNAVVFALFAFAGWNCLNPMTEELRNPSRDVPKVYFSGMCTVVCIALLFNVSFFSVLSKEELTSSLAAPFARVVAGEWLARILSILIAFCCFGSAMGMGLYTVRVIHSSATEGIFPSIFARETGSRHVPWVALYGFTAWSSVILMASPDIGIAVKFYTIGQFVFFVLVVAALIRLRSLLPDVTRPYSVNLYPLVPLLFIGSSVTILVLQTFRFEFEKMETIPDSLKSDFVDKWAIMGFCIILVGYFVFKFQNGFASNQLGKLETEFSAGTTDADTVRSPSFVS